MTISFLNITMIVNIRFYDTPSRDQKHNSHGQVVLADHSFTKRDLSLNTISSLVQCLAEAQIQHWRWLCFGQISVGLILDNCTTLLDYADTSLLSSSSPAPFSSADTALWGCGLAMEDYFSTVKRNSLVHHITKLSEEPEELKRKPEELNPLNAAHHSLFIVDTYYIN